MNQIATPKSPYVLPSGKNNRNGMWRILPSQHPSTMTERILLIGVIITVPLQAYFPTVGGMSVSFMAFGIMGLYLVINRPKKLITAAIHPVFLSAYVLIGIALFMEVANESAGFAVIVPWSFMFLGGVFVATLCRDRKAMLYSLYGFLLASLLITVTLFLTVYAKLNLATAEDFRDASQTRYSVYKKTNLLQQNINHQANQIAQGAVVAIALALHAGKGYRRLALIGVSLFCVVGTVLPMSRGGIAILSISIAAILFAYGVTRPKVLITVVVLLLTLLIGVPEIALKRLQFSLESPGGTIDARSELYKAAIKTLPDYLLTGVGVNNFYGRWGERNGFYDSRYGGAHNSFLQITMFWGILGLLAFLWVLWQAYLQLLPLSLCRVDPLRLCLLGISVSALAWLFVTHNLEHKEFSLALGLLVGGKLWIWPEKVNGLVR